MRVLGEKLLRRVIRGGEFVEGCRVQPPSSGSCLDEPGGAVRSAAGAAVEGAAGLTANAGRMARALEERVGCAGDRHIRSGEGVIKVL